MYHHHGCGDWALADMMLKCQLQIESDRKKQQDYCTLYSIQYTLFFTRFTFSDKFLTHNCSTLLNVKKNSCNKKQFLKFFSLKCPQKM